MRNRVLPDQPAGQSGAAQKINVTRLNSHYREVLSTARIEVYYCGSAAAEQVEQAWREALMGLPRYQVGQLPETLLGEPAEVREITERLEVTQGKLVMGSAREPADRLSLSGALVANAIFGGNSNSKLFLNVRERLSLCYSVNSSLDKFKGLMTVQAGAEFDKLEQVKQEVLSQLDQVRSGEFTQEELQAAKIPWYVCTRGTLDVPSQLEDFWLGQNLAGLWYGPDELAALIAEVDAQQVVEVVGMMRLDTIYRLMGSERGEEETV